MGCIYKIINILNGDFYIGQTIQKINKRFQVHKYNSKHSKNNKFHNALNNYGIENFKIELLENIEDNSKLDDIEIFYIKKLNPKYNTSEGGKRTLGFKGKKLTELHKNKLLKSNEKPIYQYDILGIFIKEWSSAKLAKDFYKCKSIGNALNNKQKSACGYLWSKFKKEFVDILVIKRSNKRVIQLDDDNNILKIWESALEAERVGGFSSSKISLVCNNKRNKHKNYNWKFYEQ